jgi:excisionase family DNA binding protein
VSNFAWSVANKLLFESFLSVDKLSKERLETPLPRLAYKVNEAAIILGVSKMSVRRLLKNNQLRAVRCLRTPLIPFAELQRFTAGLK